eukprot:8756501-Lingulodinium_polyedra.AAC.1
MPYMPYAVSMPYMAYMPRRPRANHTPYIPHKCPAHVLADQLSDSRCSECRKLRKPACKSEWVTGEKGNL